MIQKIDHLGIAVRSLDEAVPYYENALGLKCTRREDVESQKVRAAFFDCGEVHIELLEPTGPESPIAKFLDDATLTAVLQAARADNGDILFFGA
ncbi:MAG: VOC family protein, partial [Terrimicrobiaceae bacterium]